MNSEIKLKYCIKVQKGKLPSSLTDKNISNYPIYLTMDYLRGNTSDLKFVNSPNDGIKAHEDDILILWDGSNAGEILEAKKGVISSTTALITPKNEIDKRFLFFLLKSNESYFKDMSIGMGIPHVNPQELLNSSFLIPSLKKQSAIANYLDQKTTEIDRLIADKEELLKLYEEEKTAVINDLVTGKKVWNGNAWTKPAEVKDSGIEWLGEIPEHWGAVNLKWISKIYSGGTPSRNIDEYWQDGTIPWLNSGTVNQFFIEEPSEYITELALNNSSAKWIPENSILIALAGQGKTKGMVAQVLFKCTCNQSMGIIVPNEKIENRFLLYYLKNNYQNIRNLGGGDKRDGINLEMIGGISIPLIPINEQQSIVDFIETETTRIDTKIEDTQKLIELLKEYRTALISEVVTGKVKVIQD